MNILKSLLLIIGLLSFAALTTNAYYSDQATVTSNQFSTGIWGEENNHVRICHATGNSGNYQSLSMDEDGVLNGHSGQGHQDGKDIIPAFDFGNPSQNFEGQNWDEAGQLIYNNDCEIPAS